MAVTASAPGKVILFGEHAVVYGRPAIAAPVHGRRATAEVVPGEQGAGIYIVAADKGSSYPHTAADESLALAARLLLDAVHRRDTPPDLTVTVRSTIPIASGLGSGAAVSAALMRALAQAMGCPLPDDTLNALVYEVEKRHHGTPSGIDNTVVVYEQPVYFVKEAQPAPFTIGAPFTLAIADTGISSSTRTTVNAVRALYECAPAHWGRVFNKIASIAEAARAHIIAGRVGELGPLMNENHALLQTMTVSCPALDALVEAARAAGAPGAKLSGSGRGGNMIALADGADHAKLEAALREAGAVDVVFTRVE
jgi:mevalonate kinase